MKKIFFVFFFSMITFSIFAQRIYSVGILPFEAADETVGLGLAAEATRMVIAEVSPITTLTILTDEQADNGEYLVNGQLSLQNNNLVITATITQASTERILNTVREQAASLSAISMFSLCAQLTDYIPYPGYIVGKWQSTIDTIDGPVICIMDFRSNRTVAVERYDTWEHNGTNSLKYQAIGTGSYSFVGYHLRRSIIVRGQRTLTDAAFGINLTLEDALPKYKTVNSVGHRIVFDDSRSAFELVNSGIPCGDNKTGPSVYPGAELFYTKFTKIQ